MRRHPWHPAIVHFPLASWVLATLLDTGQLLGLASLTGGLDLGATSSLLLWIGLAAALPAIVTGLVDFAALPREVQEASELMWHIALMGSGSSVFLGAAIWRLRVGAFGGPVTWPIASLEIAGTMCLVAGGYFSSAVVFRRIPAAYSASIPERRS